MSTREELKAAADRLMRWSGGKDLGPRSSRGAITMLKDVFELSHSWLREHDDTPITPESLEADGWSPPNDERNFWVNGSADLSQFGIRKVWSLMIDGSGCGRTFRTMGELRTAMRLFCWVG